MPPKKGTKTVKEHNVYLITHRKYGESDKIGSLDIHQAHASLAEANEYAEAKVDELCCKLKVHTPETKPTLHFAPDGTFNMRVDLPKGSISVQVIIQPLLGGTIAHDKPRATPQTRKKAAPKKEKAKDSSDEEEDYHSEASEHPEDHGVEFHVKDEHHGDVKHEPQGYVKHEPQDDEDESRIKPEPQQDHHQQPSVRSSGRKRKATSPPPEVKEEDGYGHLNITADDIRKAPFGPTECLEGLSFFVIGTLDHWSHDEIHAIIETFGGVVEKTPKQGTNYVVVGLNPGEKILEDIKAKKLHRISQESLYRLIRDSAGGAMVSSKEVAIACKLAKGTTTAKHKAAKVAKEETEDSYSEHESE